METEKVGAVVLATAQGLGYLAKDFYDNGLINKVYIHEHTSRTNHREWYARQSIVSSPEVLLEECDSIVFFEEVWDWKIIPKAREKGIKTILMVDYECTRNPLPYYPDVIWSPSLLDQKYYPESVFITVPVPNHIKWKLRSKARLFVHNAGNGGLGGRNGTRELIEAFKYVKSDARLLIRSQIPLECNNPKIEVRIGTFDDIWSEGDVFIFPEKFNGLSLPLQEAYASGMLVMCGDRFPMNTWLPKEPLIPVKEYRKLKMAVELDYAVINSLDIANKIDEWYDRDIKSFSLKGKEWGEKNSWKNLKETYKTLFTTSQREK